MKWLLVLIIVVGIAWYMTHKPSEDTEAPPQAEATPTPAPTPPPVIKHLAPAGVYYTLQSKSIETDSGIVGITAGTKVTLVKDNGATLLVTDGQTQFEVQQAEVTNDLDMANATAMRSQAQDATAAAAARRQQEIHYKAEQAEDAREAAEQKAAANARPAATPAPTANPLSRPAYNH